MAERLNRTDVVIIGLGAAGGIAAKPLAEADIEVVGLEAGPQVTKRDYPLDEIRNDIRHWLSQPKVLQEMPTWRRNRGEEAGDPAMKGGIVIPMANAVGGTSVHWTGQSWRFVPWNFNTRSETIDRYGRGKIPSDSTLADWPIDYEDLEPYYDNVEYLHGVSGQAGNVQGERNEAGNRFEAPRRRGYPTPPLRQTGFAEMIGEVMGELDYDPFLGPASIRSESYNGLPACTYCGFCTNTGCWIDAKGGTQLSAIPQAEETGNLRVVPNARVTRIESDGDGNVTGVTYVRAGTEFLQPARVVLLAGYTYENVRMLLHSTSDAYPDGLANNNGQVGRHFMSHVYCGANGLFPGRDLSRFNGTAAQGICIDNLNSDNFDHSDLDFIGGGVITAGQEAKPIGTASATPPSVAGWGAEWKSWLKENGRSIGGILAQLECLPYEGHFLDLDPNERDPMGIPVARVTFDLGEQEQTRYDYVFERLERILTEAGATEVWPSFPKVPTPVNSHAYGGTRMGTDPETGVVDQWQMTHEAPNLGVLGASCFPTTAGYNPTETVEALAWRTADHLAESFDSIARG